MQSHKLPILLGSARPVGMDWDLDVMIPQTVAGYVNCLSPMPGLFCSLTKWKSVDALLPRPRKQNKIMLFEIVSKVLKWEMMVLSKILYFRTHRLKIKTEYSQSSDRLSVDSKGFDQYHNKPFSFDMLWFLLFAGRERRRETVVCVCVRAVSASYQCLPALGKWHSWFCVGERCIKQHDTLALILF